MTGIPPTDPKLVLDALPVSVARLDGQRRVLFANRHFCRQIGRPPEAVVGRTCRELGMHPDAFGRWEDALDESFRTGEIGGYEYVYRDPRGGDRLVEFRFAPEPGGTVLVAALTSHEVARLRRALESQEELFRAFMDCSPVIAWMRDAAGRYVYVNGTYLDRFQLTPADRIGKTAADVWPADVAALVTENDRRVAAEGKPVTVYEQTPEPDGGTTTWMNVKFPFRAADGSNYIGGVGVDVTAQRRAEDAARTLEAKVAEAQKLESLGLLAAGAAHDFSNIVMILRGHAELAAAEVPRDGPAADHLRYVTDAADRAADLCRAMLAFAGRGGGEPRPFNLSHLVHDTARLARPLLPRGGAVEFAFAEGLPPVNGDASQLRQVVLNLLTNAAEALPAGVGTIRIGTARCDGGVALSVTDNGVGMPPAVAARVFDPFYTTKPEGRGLGLAAVHGIVRAHGGSITLVSAPGKGTTFTAVFPAVTQ